MCGWRKDRKDTFLTRRFPSVLANKLISWATGVPLHDYGCSLKVFRAEIVKPLRLYGEMHRFLPAIASQMGVQIAELVVNHRPRQAGVTKYGLSRTIRVVLDLATVKFLSELLDETAADLRLAVVWSPEDSARWSRDGWPTHGCFSTSRSPTVHSCCLV